MRQIIENIANDLILANYFYNIHYFIVSPVKFFKHKIFKIKKDNIDLELNKNGYLKLNKLNSKNFKILKKSLFERFKKKKITNPKKKYLIQHEISNNEMIEEINELIDKNDINELAKNYLGFNKLKFRYFFMYSRFDNKNYNSLKGSQLFHTDGVTIKQLKLFINLNEIQKENGATDIISKDYSKKIFRISKKKNIIDIKTQKIDENFFYKNFSDCKIYSLAGPAGEANIVDTSNCYHRGGKMNFGERYLLMVQILPDII